MLLEVDRCKKNKARFDWEVLDVIVQGTLNIVRIVVKEKLGGV
jgi:hypothetical protein